jgi:two-component system sensor histidine kinase TctE
VANLVDNAIRYTPAGGVVLLRVRELEAGVMLEVQDSGPGIAAAERDKVFTPFYRVAATMEVNPSGTGLGLSIVRDIVAVHGARITLAEGYGGTGLTVRVLFPFVHQLAER